MTSPSWRDLSPEQIHEEMWGDAFGGGTARSAPRPSGIKPIWWAAGLGLAALFGYAKSRQTCAERTQRDAETLHQEYEEAMRDHLEAMRRVQRRADKSAADASRELEAIARDYPDLDRGG